MSNSNAMTEKKVRPYFVSSSCEFSWMRFSTSRPIPGQNRWWKSELKLELMKIHPIKNNLTTSCSSNYRRTTHLDVSPQIILTKIKYNTALHRMGNISKWDIRCWMHSTTKLPQHKNPEHMTDRRRMDRVGGVLPIKLRSEKTMQSKSGGKSKEKRERETRI